MAVVATLSKGYDLDYIWKHVDRGATKDAASYYIQASEGGGEPPGRWWGLGARALGFEPGQRVERKPYDLLFGERKAPDRTQLGRPPAGGRKAADLYAQLLAAEPHATADSPFEMIQAEARHRDHAIIEQVFADCSDGPFAHLPSGHFPANAAWLTCAAICHNLTRAAGTLAGHFHARARGATIRSQLISVAARIARHGRGHITLHLPEGWHRQDEWMTLFEAACRPPDTAA